MRTASKPLWPKCFPGGIKATKKLNRQRLRITHFKSLPWLCRLVLEERVKGCLVGTLHQEAQASTLLDAAEDDSISLASGGRFQQEGLRHLRGDCYDNTMMYRPLQRQSSNQPSRLEKLLEGLLGSSGGVRAEVSGRGPRFLRSCLGGNFHTESFRSKLLRSLLRNPPSGSMRKLVVALS